MEEKNMTEKKTDNTKTAYIHLAPGFEEIEALTCADWLRRAGIDAKLVSVTGKREVLGVHNILVQAATSMLAQANQQPQNVLSLLQ